MRAMADQSAMVSPAAFAATDWSRTRLAIGIGTADISRGIKHQRVVLHTERQPEARWIEALFDDDGAVRVIDGLLKQRAG